MLEGIENLRGGNSNISYVHPGPWGCMIQFDFRIFFKWVGEKPPTIEIYWPKRVQAPTLGKF